MIDPTPESVFAQLAHRPGAVWLDGGEQAGHILAFDPVEVRRGDLDPVSAGRALTRDTATGAGFSGVIGYVGYGAGHHCETVPRGSEATEPRVWLGRYASGLRYRNGQWSVSPGLEGLLEVRPPPPPVPTRAHSQRTVDQAVYEASVDRIRTWIKDGDCYQVNLSRPIHVEGVVDPFAAYRALRRSDAPFGAFLRIADDLAILSNSPELLLERHGTRLSSDPIKGTRPRGQGVAQDQALARTLRDSPKDRAELAMIVDLVRNDLNRVCEPGSVQVRPRTLTAHPTVHHASQVVVGELASPHDGWDAFRALFPPGSVTGAPKIRATERIAQLETEPRGVYCGSIGFAEDGGTMTWSVAIRTGVWSAQSLRYHVGGGIVMDSDPLEEWNETGDKALAFQTVLGA